MRIPPPGSDASDIASFVDTIVIEASRDDRRLTWAVEAERGLNLYLGNHFTTPGTSGDNIYVEGAQWSYTPNNTAAAGMVKLVLNRVQNCIIALMAIQGGDPPKITFTPRESGEPPLHYLNTALPGADQLAAQIAAQSQAAIATGAHPGPLWEPSQPLPDEDVEMLQQEIAQGQQLKAMAAQQGLPTPPGITPPEILVEVSDRTSAEALQLVFDGMEEACDAQYYFVENILNKNIVGWQPTLYEFDDDQKQHILTNVHPLQVFFDSTRSDLRRSMFAIYDEPISADEAISLYPDLAGEINDYASSGPLKFPGSRLYAPAFRYTQMFYRDMLVIRHAWFRHQPYPMTPDECEQTGKLQCQDVPMAPPPALPPAPPLVTDDEAGESSPDNEPAEAQPPATPMPIPTRKAYILPQTGQEIPPPTTGPDGKPVIHPKWPMRYSIRQVRIVANKAVEDRECEYSDIPLPTNSNIPVPYSPYAQGEPVRLEGLQMALNYVLSAIVTHQRYNAVPPQFVPESVLAQMDEVLRDAYIKPGQRVSVPDALLERFGDIKKILMNMDVQALPADFWKLLQFLVEMIDKEGNQSDVMSGNASASWSGDAIASLQNAAAQVIRAKSMLTEFYVMRLTRLKVESIIRRMGPEDWAKYCKKYPPQAIEALHQRNQILEMSISVQITSGSGASKQSQTNNLIAAKQNGVPVSDPTLMERLDLDPDVELSEQADFDRKRAASMPQIQQAQPGVAPAANNRATGPQSPVVGGQQPVKTP